MRRAKLMILEQLGLVQEVMDSTGHYRSMAAAGQIPPSGDPLEDERIRNYMMKRQRESEISRARRVDRLRKLARMDFKMLGGVSPIGFFGGAGGGDANFRPSSGQPRM